MKNKLTSLVTFYFLTSLLLLSGHNVRAQNKILFTDNFSDNHNNWTVKGKKIFISKETGYLVDITKSKESFLALQTVPLDSSKDFEITMKIQNQDKGVDAYYNAGFFFGAKDEKNGYAVVTYVGGSLKILKWIDGVPNELFSEKGNYRVDTTEKTISIKSENGRWKIGTIANIKAEPFMGNRTGVYVQKSGNCQIHSFEVAEKDKAPDVGHFAFPIAEFMLRFEELKCDAKLRFDDNVPNSKDNMNKQLTFNKSIPGFVKPTIIYKENNIEVIALKNFLDLDGAYSYFDDVKGAINLSSGSCLTDLSYKDDEITAAFLKDFLRASYWECEHTDLINGNIKKVTYSVVQGLDEQTKKDDGKKYYVLEFHFILSWK